MTVPPVDKKRQAAIDKIIAELDVDNGGEIDPHEWIDFCQLLDFTQSVLPHSP